MPPRAPQKLLLSEFFRVVTGCGQQDCCAINADSMPLPHPRAGRLGGLIDVYEKPMKFEVQRLDTPSQVLQSPFAVINGSSVLVP
jgi:hypothetical protein